MAYHAAHHHVTHLAARKFHAHRSPHPRAVVTSGGSGNLVEPLSNGLRFLWPESKLVGRYGQPPHIQGNQMLYPSWGVGYSPTTHMIDYVAMVGSTRLHCGIGKGSSKANVIRLFGQPNAKGEALYRQYLVSFELDGKGLVDGISVRPAPGHTTFR